MFFEIIVPLLAFVIVMILCYYTTKFVGGKFAVGKKNKTMKIVETLSLGLDRCLYLIKVGKKYFLFHSNKKGIELVSEIEIEELASDSEEVSESANVFEFKKIFDTYSGLSRKTTKNDDNDKSAEGSEPETIGILKNIKRLQKINNNKE